MSIFNSSLVVRSVGIGAGMALIGATVVSVALIPCATGIVLSATALVAAHKAVTLSVVLFTAFLLTTAANLLANRIIRDLSMQHVTLQTGFNWLQAELIQRPGANNENVARLAELQSQIAAVTQERKAAIQHAETLQNEVVSLRALPASSLISTAGTAVLAAAEQQLGAEHQRVKDLLKEVNQLRFLMKQSRTPLRMGAVTATSATPNTVEKLRSFGIGFANMQKALAENNLADLGVSSTTHNAASEETRLRERLMHVSQKFREMDEVYKELLGTCEDTEEQIKTRDKSIETLNSQLEEAQREVERITGELQAIREDLQTIVRDREDLQKRTEGAAKASGSRVRDLEEELQRKCSLIVELRAQIDEPKESQQSQEAIARLEEEKTGLQQQLDQAEQRIRAAEARSAEPRTPLKSPAVRSSSATPNTRAMVTALGTQLMELKRALAAQDNLKAELGVSSTAQNDASEVISLRAQLDTVSKQLQEMISEYSQLFAMCEETERVIADGSATIERLTEELEAARAKIAQLSKDLSASLKWVQDATQKQHAAEEVLRPSEAIVRSNQVSPKVEEPAGAIDPVGTSSGQPADDTSSLEESNKRSGKKEGWSEVVLGMYSPGVTTGTSVVSKVASFSTSSKRRNGSAPNANAELR